jgi:hypothetical protein
MLDLTTFFVPLRTRNKITSSKSQKEVASLLLSYELAIRYVKANDTF